MPSIRKTPPWLPGSNSYDGWLKLVDIWRKFTSLEPEKQGPAMVLSLEGEPKNKDQPLCH